MSGPRPISLSFPNGVVELTDLGLPFQQSQSYTTDFQELVNQLQGHLIPRIFGSKESLLFLQAHFQKMEIPAFPFDIDLEEEAGVAAFLGMAGGSVMIGTPIELSGMDVFCCNDLQRILVNDSGEMRIQTRWMPWTFNITDKVIGADSPEVVQKIYPHGRIEPVSLLTILEAIKKTTALPSAAPSTESVSNTLKKIALQWVMGDAGLINEFNQAKGYGFSYPARAHAEIILDIKMVIKNIATKAYERFDFTGVEKGEFSWEGFDLGAFSLPPGFPLQLSGTSDLFIRYDPGIQLTQVYIQNIKATVSQPNGLEIFLSGSLSLELSPGGLGLLRFQDLKITTPTFSGLVNGEVALDLNHSDLESLVTAANFSISNMSIVNPEGRGIRVGGWSTGMALSGGMRVKLDSQNLLAPLQVSWEGRGNLLFEKGTRKIEVGNLVFSGSSGFYKEGSSYRPKIENLQFDVGADFLVRDRKKTIYEINQFRTHFSGNHSIEDPQMSSEPYATWSIFADRVNALGLNLHPVLQGNLIQKKGEYLVTAGLSVGEKNLGLNLGATLQAKTDLKKTNWKLNFKDQAMDSIRALGAFEIKGENGEVAFQTNKPYQIFKRGESIVTDFEIQGSYGRSGLTMDFFTKSVLDQISFKGHIDSPSLLPLSGDYKIKLIRPLEGSEKFSISEGDITGKFSDLLRDYHTPNLSGEVHLKLEGELQGPVSMVYHLHPRISPRAAHTLVEAVIDPVNKTTLAFGPLDFKGSQDHLRGQVELQGALGVTLQKNPKLVGYDLGISNGALYYGHKGQVAADESGAAIPVLQNLSVTTGRTHYDGGILFGDEKGIKVTADSRKVGLKFFYFTEKQFLNKDGYWKLFQELIQRAHKNEPVVVKEEEEPVPVRVHQSPEDPKRHPILPDPELERLEGLPAPPQTKMAAKLYELLTQLEGLDVTTQIYLPLEDADGRMVATKTEVVIKDRGLIDRAQVTFNPGLGPIKPIPFLSSIPILSPFFQFHLLEVHLRPEDRRLGIRIRYLLIPVNLDKQPFDFNIHGRIVDQIKPRLKTLKGEGYDLSNAVPLYAWQLAEILEKAAKSHAESPLTKAQPTKDDGTMGGTTPRFDQGGITLTGTFKNETLKMGGITAQFHPDILQRLQVTGSLSSPFISIKGLKSLVVDHAEGQIKIFGNETDSLPISAHVFLEPQTLTPKSITLMPYKSKRLRFETTSHDAPNSTVAFDLKEGIDIWGLKVDLEKPVPRLQIQQLVAKQIQVQGLGMDLKTKPGAEAVLSDVSLSVDEGRPRFYAKVRGQMGGEIDYFVGDERVGAMNFEMIGGNGEILVEPDFSRAGMTKIGLAGNINAQMDQLRLLVHNEQIAAYAQTEIRDARITGSGNLFVWPKTSEVLVETSEPKAPLLVEGKQGRVVFHQETSEVQAWKILREKLGDRARDVKSHMELNLKNIRFGAERLDMRSSKRKNGGAALEVQQALMGPISMEGDLWGTLYVKGGDYFIPIVIRQEEKMEDVVVSVDGLIDEEREGTRQIRFSNILINGNESSPSFPPALKEICGIDRQHLHAIIGFFSFSPGGKMGNGEDSRRINFGDLVSHFHVNLGNLLSSGCVKIHEMENKKP